MLVEHDCSSLEVGGLQPQSVLCRALIRSGDVLFGSTLQPGRCCRPHLMSTCYDEDKSGGIGVSAAGAFERLPSTATLRQMTLRASLMKLLRAWPMFRPCFAAMAFTASLSRRGGPVRRKMEALSGEPCAV